MLIRTLKQWRVYRECDQFGLMEDMVGDALGVNLSYNEGDTHTHTQRHTHTLSHLSNGEYTKSVTSLA